MSFHMLVHKRKSQPFWRLSERQKMPVRDNQHSFRLKPVPVRRDRACEKQKGSASSISHPARPESSQGFSHRGGITVSFPGPPCWTSIQNKIWASIGFWSQSVNSRDWGAVQESLRKELPSRSSDSPSGRGWGEASCSCWQLIASWLRGGLGRASPLWASLLVGKLGPYLFHLGLLWGLSEETDAKAFSTGPGTQEVLNK